jgi:hypothetical protein
LTLGPDCIIEGGGAYITDAVFEDGSATIINQGRISATAAGILIVNPSTFVNEGTVEAVDGGSLGLGGAWTNAPDGTISAVNAELTLGGTMWTNQGLISAVNSDVWITGDFATADLGDFQRVGGQVFVTADVDNTGATLNIDSTTGSWYVNNALIHGGTVNFADGERMEFGDFSYGSPVTVFENVTINSDLIIRKGTEPGASEVRLADGAILNGDVSVDDWGTLKVNGGQEFDGHTVSLGMSQNDGNFYVGRRG